MRSGAAAAGAPPGGPGGMAGSGPPQQGMRPPAPGMAPQQSLGGAPGGAPQQGSLSGQSPGPPSYRPAQQPPQPRPPSGRPPPLQSQSFAVHGGTESNLQRPQLQSSATFPNHSSGPPPQQPFAQQQSFAQQPQFQYGQPPYPGAAPCWAHALDPLTALGADCWAAAVFTAAVCLHVAQTLPLLRTAHQQPI